MRWPAAIPTIKPRARSVVLRDARASAVRSGNGHHGKRTMARSPPELDQPVEKGSTTGGRPLVSPWAISWWRPHRATPSPHGALSQVTPSEYVERSQQHDPEVANLQRSAV